MNFKEAYEEMLKGKKVKRKNWEDYKTYALNEDNIYFVDKIIVLNIAVEDVLAEDWEVVEESKENKVWKPKEDEIYFVISNGGTIFDDVYLRVFPRNEARLALGNCFKTKKEAEHMVEKLKVIKELKDFALENNEEEIDWKNLSQRKYVIIYSPEDQNVDINCYWHTQYIPFNIHFTSEKIAQNAIETIGEDRIKKYYFDVEE